MMMSETKICCCLSFSYSFWILSIVEGIFMANCLTLILIQQFTSFVFKTTGEDLGPYTTIFFIFFLLLMIIVSLPRLFSILFFTQCKKNLSQGYDVLFIIYLLTGIAQLAIVIGYVIMKIRSFSIGYSNLDVASWIGLVIIPCFMVFHIEFIVSIAKERKKAKYVR